MLDEVRVITESAIACPACGTVKTEQMPVDSCLYFYECTSCGRLLRPKPGDCCVFCSYGSVPCPPIQAAKDEAPCCQSAEGRMTTEIRPGVQRPDWSAVTMPAARNALLGRNFSRASLIEKWKRALSPEQDLVWRRVLELFGTLGRAPTLDEIAEKSGIPPNQIHERLAELQAQDLVGLWTARTIRSPTHTR
jgi:hypothetical protein